MLDVVVDTSAIIAIINRGDPHHRRAVMTLTELDSAGARLAISNYAVSETFALSSRRFGMEAARDVQRILLACEVLWTTAIEHASATSLFLKTGRGLSFVDCATIAAMRKRGLVDVFSFDTDFAVAGLNTIPEV